MIPIFRDSHLNEQFDINGFVKIPLFNPAQIRELKDFYYSTEAKQNKVKEAFYATSHFNNQDLMIEVSDFIKPYFLRELDKHLKDCEYTISNFLVKQSTDDSAVKCHEDWTFVDESQYISFNAWVCLDDADYQTGNMQFIPGSHKFFPSLRAAPNFPRYYDKIQKILPHYLIDVPTHAGECLIFSHSTIHASRRNRSGRSRISCVIGGRHAGTEIFHYYCADEQAPYHIEKYKMDIQSFIELERNQRPGNAPLTETFIHEVYYMSEKEFHQKAARHTTPLYRLRNRILNLIIS